MAKSMNGKAGATLKGAIGALRLPDTELLELGSVWVSLIIPNQANQLFRSRLMTMKDKGIDITDMSSFDFGTAVDPDGKVSEKVIDLVHTCFIADWGGYDDKGKCCPLVDDDGEYVECTLENFTSVVRDNEGGDALFFAIQGKIAQSSNAKIERVGQEKNSLGKSPALPAKDKKQPTPRGRKLANASTS